MNCSDNNTRFSNKCQTEKCFVKAKLTLIQIAGSYDKFKTGIKSFKHICRGDANNSLTEMIQKEFFIYSLF